KWTTDRTEKENGLDLSPRWPVVDIKPCTLVRLGCKRTGKKTQTYTVQFHNVEEKENYQCDFSESVWKTYALGSEWTADVNMLGSVKCDSLKPLSK
ncbi:MAG: hypothetical protein VX278_06925, partial [Myxococcota bacterium]|nr:hypothetical protein [Myxococcota bacterium]